MIQKNVSKEKVSVTTLNVHGCIILLATVIKEKASVAKNAISIPEVT